MTYTKICPVCGKQFQTQTDKAKYCSASCRWSGFKERTRSEARQEAEAEQEAESRKWKAERAAQARQRQQEVEAAAGAGDPFCRMITAKRFSPEYFSALADYEDQYAQRSGRASSTCTINGLDIYGDSFPEEAAASVAESNACILRH